MTLPDSLTLTVRLQRVQRRVRRLLWAYGLGRVLTIVVGAILFVGLADWQFHLDDPGLRLMLCIAILAGAAWSIGRFLVAPLSRPISDMDSALRIESRYPQFRDSLSSTIQFLREGTAPRLGSPELQQRVIDETAERLESVDLADIIDPRPVRRAIAAAVVVCALAVLVTVANPPAAGLAAKRLMLPYATNAWPRRTNLHLLTDHFEIVEYRADAPLRAVRGSTLDFFVEDADGKLPEDVQLEYQIGEGTPVWEALRRATLHDEQGKSREVCALRIPTSEGPVHFRVVGGDDDKMPHYRLDVIPPPVIEELQVSLTPPAYSELPAEKLSPGVGHIQALVGTQVDAIVRMDSSVTEARLRIRDKDSIPLKLSADGRSFRATFKLNEPGVYSYGFDLLDHFGFVHQGARYEVRATADLVPQVSIELPESDINVTVDAEIPVRVVSRDDIRLREVRLHYQLGESTDAASAVIPLDVPSGSGRPVVSSFTWKLADLRLKEGLRIPYHAEATDAYNLGSEHVGRSPTRAFMVISHTEKANEIASRQMSLIEQLSAIRGKQQQASEQVGELQLQWGKAGELRPADLDLLKRVELDQRRISSQLHDPQAGISAQTQTLMDELKHNHVQNLDIGKRLERIANELSELNASQSTAIEQKLSEALKEAENSRSSIGDANQPSQKDTTTAAQRGLSSLEMARQAQVAVVETLDNLLRDLGRWRDQRELSADLGEMIARQKELNAETSETGRRTLTKSVPELSPQERADLARLADRQSRQGESLKSFQDELKQTQANQKSSEENSIPFADLGKLLDQQATAGKMRETSQRLIENQVGNAMADQQQILANLQQAEKLLSDRPDLDLESRLAKIHKTEEDLEELRKREDRVLQTAKQGEASKAPSDSSGLEQLKKDQRDARDQAGEIARELKRLQIHRPAESLRRAATRMQQVEQDLAGHSRDEATQNAQEALDDVEQAQRETARARRQAEQQLARETLEKLAGALQGMLVRQQSIIDETSRLEAERIHRGNWSRGQLKSLANVAETQRDLKGETSQLAEKVKDAAVFHLALRQTAEEMDRAAERLSRRLTDGATLDVQRQARKRFVDLIAALATERDRKAQSEQADQEGQEQAEDVGEPGDEVTFIAQLKMLKMMQEDLRLRTSAVDQLLKSEKTPSDEQQQRISLLAEEQGKLAEIAGRLALTILGTDSDKGNHKDESHSDDQDKKQNKAR